MSEDAPAGTLLSTFSSSDRQVFSVHLQRMEHLDRTLEGRKTNDYSDFRSRWMANLRRVDGRKVLLTSKGHMGWAPPAAEIDDVVIVIPGCHVPMVIRRVHVEKLDSANLVYSHDANRCTHSGCEGFETAIHRIIGESCHFSVQLLEMS
jgi:hypothetical protein